jgi:hypothetical protein
MALRFSCPWIMVFLRHFSNRPHSFECAQTVQTVLEKDGQRLGSNLGPITSKQGLKPAINNHVSA